MDNTAIHINSQEFSNITLHFFSPNTTAYIQPCDIDIIHSFKSHYHKILCKYKIDEYDLSQINGTDIHPINIYNAIQFVDRAWHSVTPESIQ